MSIYDINDMGLLIKDNSYVGRGIVIGKTEDGKKAATAYFIMGRSENSRNRVFSLKDGAVFCEYYPRPMLKRDSFFSLNGIWDFGVSDNEIVYDKKIRVPFCPESLLSEVNQAFDEDKILFYKKEFTLPEDFNKGRVILHFGAVDQCCEVYLNNTFNNISDTNTNMTFLVFTFSSLI